MSEIMQIDKKSRLNLLAFGRRLSLVRARLLCGPTVSKCLVDTVERSIKISRQDNVVYVLQS